MESLGERLSMFEAKTNFAKYHDLDYDDMDELRVRNSGAGVFGWAAATIDYWHDLHTLQLLSDRGIDRSILGDPVDPVQHDLIVERSGMGMPPATDEDRHGEQFKTKKPKDPPESKPQLSPEQATTAVKAYGGELEAREKVLRWQNEMVRSGRELVGVHRAKDLGKVLEESWKEVKRERRDAEAERRRAELHVVDPSKQIRGHSCLRHGGLSRSGGT